MKNIDWTNLPFGYYKTDYNVRSYYKDGQWSDLEVSDSEYFSIHMASTCLHYGQEAFEGLKAYRGQDDKIRLFRWQENAKRIRHSAQGILMPDIPDNLFFNAIKKAVQLNNHYVPPYNSGATLYIRPLLIGITPEIGVKPSNEFMFIVFVSPEGPYFKEGFKPADYIICRSHDRAAPLGTGNFKVGGNYAASLKSLMEAVKKGYNSVVYLDPKEKKYIDECGPSNFFAIKKNTYITPDSPSILPSVTNKSLMEMAQSMGMKVEKRKVPVTELSSFEEAGGCGTAAVISPIRKIFDPDFDIVYEFSRDNKPGPVSVELYRKLTAIQYGDEEDIFGWIDIID
jgi:branched-chain amino acid aminotransferase